MSQVKTLPITVTRWLSLLLCAITAATITVFLSKVGFVQQAYMKWGSILNTSPVLHYSFAFLAGIGIKLMLDKFYISHAKRSIGFSFKYPPVTISLWLSIILIGSIFYFTSNQEELIAATSCFEYFIVLILGSSIITAYQQGNEKISLSLVVCFSLIAAISAVFIYLHISHTGFSWPLFIVVDVYILSVIFLIGKYVNGWVKAKWNRNQTTLDCASSLSSNDFKTLEQFKHWFKDDSTIKNIEQLEPDLQVYATRIAKRLRTGGDTEGYEKRGAQHIALCGPYGCGKSSIVDSIVSELAKSPKQDGGWIHSDISTWGAASGSVAHVILSNIIDDISQHIDMCAFRALPKHYTEAMKFGPNWLKFLSSLLAGPVDIDERFLKLNKVLEVTNHKLLITLQDVDRGTGDENEKRLNEIAALLDRLRNKDLSNINFIVAMGNDKPEDFEVISKATDYREDIAKNDFRKTLASFTRASIDEAKNNHSKIILYRYSNTHEKNKLDQVIAIIDSPRQLKKVLRRVNQAWQSKKLMGEVNFYSLLMVTALREANPTCFERYCKADSYLESKIKSNEDDLDNVLREIAQLSKEDSGSQQSSIIKSEFIYSYLQVMLDVKKDSDGKLRLDSSKDHQQSVGCTHSDVYYLRRILLEKVPSNELKDQDVMKALRNGENKEKLNNHIHEAQYSLFESNALLCPKSMR
ncbi:P-loop NTPase fold protein [Pseudoalteromonas sp. KJ71-7]|uniref:P-loop NTPase fold protein n=1 Tax=Pseudoalteromonas sp. KJ71-7 TaxID=3391824 RepID=UPI0039AF0BA6